jgi:hypothetical protein
VITEKIEGGFLGLDEKEPSNLVGSYSLSGGSLKYDKPRPGRVVFMDHTWVEIEGQHYDPVSGLSGATKPPVQQMEKGTAIKIELNGQPYTVSVYEKDGVTVFKLPVEDEQAKAKLSAPLAEAWVVVNK